MPLEAVRLSRHSPPCAGVSLQQISPLVLPRRRYSLNCSIHEHVKRIDRHSFHSRNQVCSVNNTNMIRPKCCCPKYAALCYAMLCYANIPISSSSKRKEASSAIAPTLIPNLTIPNRPIGIQTPKSHTPVHTSAPSRRMSSVPDSLKSRLRPGR